MKELQVGDIVYVKTMFSYRTLKRYKIDTVTKTLAKSKNGLTFYRSINNGRSKPSNSYEVCYLETDELKIKYTFQEVFSRVQDKIYKLQRMVRDSVIGYEHLKKTQEDVDELKRLELVVNSFDEELKTLHNKIEKRHK